MAYPTTQSPLDLFAKPKQPLQSMTSPTQAVQYAGQPVAPGTPSMAPQPTTVTRTATPAPAPTSTTSVGMRPGGTQITSQSPYTGSQYGQNFTDIRSRMFLPSTSGTNQAAGNTDQIANRLRDYQFPDFNGIGAGDYQVGGDVSDLRRRIMEQLEGAGRPDRAGLAAQAFDLMRTRSDPAFQQALRGVGQKNAALGRLGAGMVTNELMDVTAQRERDLGLAQRDLALEAAGMSLQDRLAQLNASQGVFDQFNANDRADAGLKLGLRNEARDERGAGLAYGLDKFQAQQGLLGQLGNLEGMRFGQDASMRDEMRGERAWQQGMNQTAMDNALRERLTQEQIFGNDYNRWLQGIGVFGGLGFTGDPSATMLTGAGQYGQQAAGGREGLADLGQNWSYMDWLRRNGGVQY